MSIEPEPSLSSAQRGKIRRLVRGNQAEQVGEGGELNVVPYLDIVLNIVLFVLGGLSIIFVASIDSRAASITPGPREPVSPTALRFTALVTAEGVSLKTAAGNLAPGCDGLGPGLTVPAKDGKQDIAKLAACARKVKEASPAFREETQVTLSADPGVDVQTLVDVMDALRNDERGPLFPEVAFGIVR
jgi:biopolymer transport protein ExbD